MRLSLPMSLIGLLAVCCTSHAAGVSPTTANGKKLATQVHMVTFQMW